MNNQHGRDVQEKRSLWAGGIWSIDGWTAFQDTDPLVYYLAERGRDLFCQWRCSNHFSRHPHHANKRSFHLQRDNHPNEQLRYRNQWYTFTELWCFIIQSRRLTMKRFCTSIWLYPTKSISIRESFESQVAQLLGWNATHWAIHLLRSLIR